MSRGLGKLQREILVTLEEAKHHFRDRSYPGSGEPGPVGSETWRWDRPGRVQHRGTCFRIELPLTRLPRLTLSEFHFRATRTVSFARGTEGSNPSRSATWIGARMMPPFPSSTIGRFRRNGGVPSE